MTHPDPYLTPRLRHDERLLAGQFRAQRCQHCRYFMGAGFCVCSVGQRLLGPSISSRGWIALALVTVWAVRLGSHILARWRRLGHEDYRYAEIRKGHEPGFRYTSLFWIFWLQALLLWVISWPLQAIFSAPRGLNLVDALGVALAVGGIAIEAVADRQLTQFRADAGNKERVLNTGLWAWSRHPNYFGDFTLWWGFYVLAIAGGAPWWTIAGPVSDERAADPLFGRGFDGGHYCQPPRELCGLYPPHQQIYSLAAQALITISAIALRCRCQSRVAAGTAASCRFAVPVPRHRRACDPRAQESRVQWRWI